MMLLIGSKKGFTLIEIMFAGVILSFGLVLALHSFATALEGIRRSENIKAGSYFLEEKMEEIKNKAKEENGIARGESSGTFTPLTPTRCKWGLEVTPSDVDEDLNKVELKILWMEGKNQRSLFATTYLEAENRE